MSLHTCCVLRHAEHIAKENGLEIEFIRKLDAFRKDDRIQTIIEKRGTHPGLVHIFSAMETCPSYKPWHDKQTGKTFVKNDSSKCPHYYFYFIDPDFGLCYLRVPTWCPFRLQFYMNGHNWLASRLSKQGVAYQMRDNAFLRIDDWEKAKQLSDHIRVEDLHQVLDILANRYCPVIKKLGVTYRWSIMQVEYATDIAFRNPEDLKFLYEAIVEPSTPLNRRTSPHSWGRNSMGITRAKWATTLTNTFSVENQASYGCQQHQNVRQVRPFAAD